MRQIARCTYSFRKPLSYSAVLVFVVLLLHISPTSKRSRCEVYHTPKPITVPLERIPKFNSDSKSVKLCLLLPDASSTYIWSGLELPRTKLRPSFMKRLIKNRPSRAHIQRLANQIVSAGESLRILILSSQSDSKWPQRLQTLVNDVLGTKRVKILTTSSTDQNDILEKASHSHIVVDCRGQEEMKQLKTRFSDLTVLPDAINYLHALKQSRIRSMLVETTNPQSLAILIGEPPTNSNILSSSVYSRTVQRLAHWYQLGYIMKERRVDDAFEQVVAFALLEWFIDFCSSPPLHDSTALLPGVQERVEQVVPPSLELSTTWKRISKEWHAIRHVEAE